MVISHGTLSVPAPHIAEVRQLLLDIAASTRQEPGCTLYLVSEDLAQPGHFVMTEHWDSMAHMQTHLALPGVGQAVQQAHALGGTDLTITAYESGTATRVM